ncbi:MAG: hypothetical protein FJX46_17810 [Alphaproteobacteria bacterium]|nr:hypothetical protein [Alphaproteobacteria bacterium]
MRRRAIAVLAALQCALAGSAQADAIDGTWCHRDGRHFVILGPKIVTPGGAAIEGRYGRHDFSYVVPGREPDAGRTVLMLLVNEQTVHWRLDASTGAPEIWKRCTVTTS